MNRRLRQFIYWDLIVLTLFFIVILPNILPFPMPQEQQDIIKSKNDVKSADATVAVIFNNNMLIAGLTLIPYVGWGFLIYIMWNTGTTIATYHVPWYYPLMNFFAWIELSVYAYVVLQSIKLVHLWKQRRCNDFKYTFAKTIAFAFIVATIVLLASAELEYWLIKLVT